MLHLLKKKKKKKLGPCDGETERDQAKEMQLNEYTAFLSSVKKNKIEANPIYGCWC